MILIRNAGVHAPEPLGVNDILIIDDRIASIAAHLECPRLPGRACEVIDAGGLLALPGMVDPLVHVIGGGGEAGFGSRTRPLDPDYALRHGITSLVGCLGTDAITRSHADLLATCRALRDHGIGAWCLTGAYGLPAPTLTGSVESDLVLIPEIIGIGEIALGDHRGSQPDLRRLVEAVAEARRGALLAGKRGTALLHLGDGGGAFELIERAVAETDLPRGQFYPTHCNRSEATLEAACAFGRAGGNIDLTTSTTPALIDAGEVPAARALALALQAGVEPQGMTLSSDGQASLPDYDVEGELQSSHVADPASLWHSVRGAIVEHGVELGAALASVSANPARIMGLKDCGRLRPGLRADVLLADPETLELTMTISKGRVCWQHEELAPRCAEQAGRRGSSVTS